MYNAIVGSCAEQEANATTPAYTLDGISFSDYGAATGLNITELVNGPDELLLADYASSSIKSYSFDDSAVPSFSSADDTLSIGNNTSRALVFGDSGNYIYIGGVNASTNIVRYALSTAYDIGTTTGSTQTVNSSLYSSGAQGLAFNDTGTKLFVADGSSVITLTLNTAWDLSAGSKTTNNLSGTTDDDGDNMINYTGIRFNPTGTKMFISYRNSAGNPASGSANHPKLAEFDLSTGFDVSTASFARSMSVNNDIGQYSSTASTFIGGFDWNSDGTKLFIGPVHPDALDSNIGPKVCRYTF